MKTGYDQHFKKVKQTSKAPSFNVQLKKEKTISNNFSSRGLKNSLSSQNKIKKSKFPVMPLFSFLFIVCSGLYLLENFDSIELYLKKIEFGLDAAQAEETPSHTAAVASAPAGTTENKVTEAAQNKKIDEKAEATQGKKSENVEAKKVDDADYLFKLAERKKQLDQREEDLKKVAEQIEKQKIEITEKLAKLEETRLKISSALEDKIKVDDSKVETLVQMYSNMKPVQAAKVFETLDEDLVVEILSRMKKKNAADILNLIKPEKAQILAERYTGYRAPASRNK